MDNEEIYGEVFSKMSFKDAIATKLLTDYKIVTIDVAKEEIASFIRKNKLVELNPKYGKEASLPYLGFSSTSLFFRMKEAISSFATSIVTIL